MVDIQAEAIHGPNTAVRPYKLALNYIKFQLFTDIRRFPPSPELSLPDKIAFGVTDLAWVVAVTWAAGCRRGAVGIEEFSLTPGCSRTGVQIKRRSPARTSEPDS